MKVLEIADIFRLHGSLLPKQHTQAKKVIQDIKNCRTSVLGGHKLQCESCEFTKNAYNSCRNRHCPKCQYLTRVKWVEKQTQDLLDCQYFHVVFTIPAELRPLFLQNKKHCYNLLFKASAETLKEVAENPKNLGAEIGFTGVLHTWGQNLVDHAHIHYVVPGGGLDKKKTKWIACRQDYFLPVKVLSKVFKGKLLEYLRKYYKENKLLFFGKIKKLECPKLWEELLTSVAFKDWVVYSKEPFNGAEQVIKYLGRYTHRIAISNQRIVKLQRGRVYFKCRDLENPGKTKVTSLEVKEFMRRFLLHVLPKKFVRIRHFGLLGNRLRKKRIELIRKLKGVVKKTKDLLQNDWKDLLKIFDGLDVRACPSCKKGVLTEVFEFPNALLNTS